MRKTGVIYLSISGHTAEIAQWISEMDSTIVMLPIALNDSIPKYKWQQVVKYGYKTIFNRHLDFRFDFKKAASCDRIIIGSPVWIGRIPAPVRDVISNLDMSEKVIAGFCTYDDDPGDFQDQLFAFTDSHPFVGFLSFKEPIGNQRSKYKDEMRLLVEQMQNAT
jgi:flavodoxin